MVTQCITHRFGSEHLPGQMEVSYTGIGDTITKTNTHFVNFINIDIFVVEVC